MMLRLTVVNGQTFMLSDVLRREVGSMGYNCDRVYRLHEGCGEEWDTSDVVWLRLRLNDQLYLGACVELLGEMALLAEGNDVVVKAWRLRSQMMEPSKAVLGRGTRFSTQSRRAQLLHRSRGQAKVQTGDRAD